MEVGVDLFEIEQRLFDDAVLHIENVREGGPFDFEKYVLIVKEYGKMLKQARSTTRISDKTTINLYESNLDLLDKVYIDALTGIYSRQYMESNMSHIIKYMSRSGGQLSVMMLDIDYFKPYNDTYGHSMGDDCLKTVAQAIAGSLQRAEDFAARYGGEEFIVVLPNTGEDGARKLAVKILENVRACNIPHETSKADTRVTISIGVTANSVEYTQNIFEYIKCADEALYVSKHTGRNRYTYMNFKGEEA